MNARKPQQLCVVTIGYDDCVLPMATGARVVADLSRALPVKRRYSAPGEAWEPEDKQPRVLLTAIRPSQIVDPPMPSHAGGRRRPLMITTGD